MKKKLLCSVLVLVFLLVFSMSAFAASAIKVNINGSSLSFDNPPVIQNGTTLVPMRAIFEALGASVAWDGKTQTVTGAKDETTVVLKINSTTAKKNGKAMTLSVPAKIINGSTMVPLRFISESFNCKLNWHKSTQTIDITYTSFQKYYPNSKIPTLQNLYSGLVYGIADEETEGIAYYYNMFDLNALAIQSQYEAFLEENGFEYISTEDLGDNISCDVYGFKDTEMGVGVFIQNIDDVDFLIIVVLK